MLRKISALYHFHGVYFGCFGDKQSSAKEYLLGGKEMSVIPVSISLVASHISGLTLLAVPADVYAYGAGYGLLPFALVIVYFLTVYVYLPVFYNLQVTSLYEYLERRFDYNSRILASFLFTVAMLMYLPIVIYIPALALSAATGVNVHFITPVVCGVCIFYTTIGGLKAVVWTDTIQFTVTIGSLLTVFFMGLKSAGGFGQVWDRASIGQRLSIPLGLDLTERDSYIAIILGFAITWLSFSAVNQGCVQKFLSLPTYGKAKLSVVLFIMGMSIVTLFSVFTGLIMYAKYYQCDPFTSKAIKKHDQILPYYVLDVAGSIPGLPGLFIAGIFCAALSTLSATLNCMAGTIYEDFLVKLLPEHTEKTTASILKLIVLITGIVCTALVYVIEMFESVLPTAFTFGGITGGPTVALFTMGMLMPHIKGKAAYYGSIFGLIVMAYIGFTAQYYKTTRAIYIPTKPLSIEGCFVNNTEEFMNIIATTASYNSSSSSSIILNTVNATTRIPKQEVFALFRISHYYFTIVGCLISMIAALIISCFEKDKKPADKNLISPLVHFLLPPEHCSLDVKYKDVKEALASVTTGAEKD
ncbi:sodium-coupled monocarboxylate transporter 2 isoform X2 [Aethina tumida]|uniref:sodium-coupled monocarboxylate transporter 2 isoform X2 n=1 Tax=Aethina tumida TaxID=116153 RepID=UPI0021479DAA|nr:sodium-coupled monocarboxylate transporter 2 isoform X2 [Aethina tumida]